MVLLATQPLTSLTITVYNPAVVTVNVGEAWKPLPMLKVNGANPVGTAVKVKLVPVDVH